MQLKAHFCLLAYLLVCLLGLSCAKSLYSDSDTADVNRRIIEVPRPRDYRVHEVQKLHQEDTMALARQRAIQVIMEKMLIALGPDFLQGNHGIPDNETYPTVASPLNLTTDPCPEIYIKCSSENFLSSCHPPEDANIELWNQRLNLYFDLPHNLRASDNLLNATLRIYKNNTLPLRLSARLEVELFVYEKSPDNDYDITEYDSRSISNDYIGWISFDVTDLIRRLNLTEHHVFLIKVKEYVGTYWNAPSLIVPMKCSEDNKTVVPIPFGVITDQPEQKYPSLTITTGMKDQYYYSGMESEHAYDNHAVLDQNFFDHEYEQDFPYENNHREIVDDYGQEKSEVNNLDNEKEYQHRMNYDQDYNQEYGQTYEKQHEKNNWFDDGKQMEEINHSQKRHHPRRKNKQHKKKMLNDDPKAHREILPMDEDYSEMQYNFQEEQHPVEHSHSKNRDVVQKYNSKSFRKPVENQVYSNHMSADHLDLPPPTVRTAADVLSSTKAWHGSDMKTSETIIGHHRGSKRRDKNRRRHHNHHQSEHSESHRSHHSRSHSRNRSHNDHENRGHDRSIRHEVENVNLQIDS